MSTPISFCVISKAALGDEKTFVWLVEAMEYNLRCGAYTMGGCDCNPQCPVPSGAQLEDLNRRVTEGVAALRKKLYADRPLDKKRHPPGAFEKFIFPVIKNMPPMDLLL